jgi:hypothetical protein
MKNRGFNTRNSAILRLNNSEILPTRSKTRAMTRASSSPGRNEPEMSADFQVDVAARGPGIHFLRDNQIRELKNISDQLFDKFDTRQKAVEQAVEVRESAQGS